MTLTPLQDGQPALTVRESVRRGLPYLGVVALVHVLALLFLIPAALHTPLLWGLGLTAYLFGVRHAWDADHIAVIDNTIRKLLTLGRPADGVGLFFSLGHSSVVLLMGVAAALIGQALLGAQDGLGTFGGWVGPFVAGAYLMTVAVVNLYSAWRIGTGRHDAHEHLHGGLLARLIGPLTRLVSRQGQVFPLGFLMGLGFDTASEVALLALAGSAAQQGLGWTAILSLPLLFAAGMSALDTLDGLAMAHAYRWALVNPQAKRSYNLLITALSGLIALIIGAVTLLQWAQAHLHLRIGVAAAWDVSPLGFWLAGLTLVLFSTFRWLSLKRPAPGQPTPD